MDCENVNVRTCGIAATKNQNTTSSKPFCFYSYMGSPTSFNT